MASPRSTPPLLLRLWQEARISQLAARQAVRQWLRPAMKRRCASGRETLCTRTTYRITKAYIKNIKTTINMNIMTSNTIRITTRNHDRALKVPRHCVTIKKKKCRHEDGHNGHHDKEWRQRSLDWQCLRSPVPACCRCRVDSEGSSEVQPDYNAVCAPAESAPHRL